MTQVDRVSGDNERVADATLPAVIGVSPAAERVRRQRLFDALEAAYPVRFVRCDTGQGSQFDGLFHLGEDREADPGRPTLIASGEERRDARRRRLALAEHPVLHQTMRGATLSEETAGGLELDPSEEPVATLDGLPAWAVAGRRQRVIASPAELGPEEALRSRLAPGRSLALLALVQFVRALTSDRDWARPAPRAAFLIDDPNLRRTTYGYVDYAALLESGRQHGYHTAMAMVPLDGRVAHRDAVELFHDGAAHLSLCVHGNDHEGAELGRPQSRAAALVPVGQALQRIEAFERRTGLGVDRVMVAPHERVSEGAAAAMLALGFEAFSGTRPYPWLGLADDLDWLSRPSESGPLVGWGSAELMPGGFPWLMRMGFGHSREEVPIRAFLGQPIVIYGHHEALAGGTENLERIAAEVNRVGEVRWTSLSEIARAGYERRRRGNVLELRMQARHIRVDVPAGLDELRIRVSALGPATARCLILRDRSGESLMDLDGGEVVLPSPVDGPLELRLRPAADYASVAAPRLRAFPLIRRIVTETRDRSRPLVPGRQ